MRRSRLSPAVMIVGAIIVWFFGNKLYEFVSTMIGDFRGSHNSADLGDDSLPGNQPLDEMTMDYDQASSIAAQCYQALQYSSWTTVNSQLMDVVDALVSVQNKADMLQVINAYGVRSLGYSSAPEFKGALDQCITFVASTLSWAMWQIEYVPMQAILSAINEKLNLAGRSAHS